MKTKINKTKKVESIEEIEKNWKECFIPSMPKVKKPTKKILIEGWNIGMIIKRRIR